MRDHERIARILDLIRELWERNPDQRLGQLLINYVFTRFRNPHYAISTIWNTEDDATEAALYEALEAVRK